MLICFLIPSSVSHASELLSQSQFAQKFVKAIEKSIPQTKVRKIAPLKLEVITPDQSKFSLFLGNAYDAYKVDPKNINAVFSQYITAIKRQAEQSSVNQKTLGREFIVPLVRSRDYLETIRRQYKKHKPNEPINIVHEKINKDLYAFYSFDTPTVMRSLSIDDLKQLKLKLSDLRELAQRNLMRIVGKKIKVKQGDGFHAIFIDENYESSLMLVDAFWSEKMIPVKGDYVVFVPVRGMLFVTGSENAQGIKSAKQLAGEIYKKFGRKISNKGFVRRSGKWTVFQ